MFFFVAKCFIDRIFCFRTMKKYISLLIIICLVLQVQAQTNNQARREYIEKYKGIAVKKMLEYGIPASITLAQGILESGAGYSPLAVDANNHFGIKCHVGWTGDTFHMDDDLQNECFRKYKNAEESFNDHSLFLTSRSRYDFLFDIDRTDYEGWAHGLKKAGYATNPQYAPLLIKVITEENLAQYDKINNLEELGLPVDKTPDSDLPEIAEDEPEMPKDDFKPVSVSKNQRIIYENEGVKYVLALKGDSFEKIAEEFGIYSWQVRNYNDAPKSLDLKPGEFIYLEKKNSKAGVSYHIMQYNEDLRLICQKYAVRMSEIKKLNGIKSEDEVRTGERLKLK